MSICDVWWDLDFVSEFILGLGESHIKPDHLGQVVGGWGREQVVDE